MRLNIRFVSFLLVAIVLIVLSAWQFYPKQTKTISGRQLAEHGINFPSSWTMGFDPIGLSDKAEVTLIGSEQSEDKSAYVIVADVADKDFWIGRVPDIEQEYYWLSDNGKSTWFNKPVPKDERILKAIALGRSSNVNGDKVILLITDKRRALKLVDMGGHGCGVFPVDQNDFDAGGSEIENQAVMRRMKDELHLIKRIAK